MRLYGKKYAGQAADDNTAHAHCMPDMEGFRHTFRICNVTAFLLQQWSNERTPMALNTYTASTVCCNEIRKAQMLPDTTNIQCGLTSFGDDHGFAAEDTSSFPLWVCTLRFGDFMRFITIPLNLSSNPCM
jgi:hypothetical protein